MRIKRAETGEIASRGRVLQRRWLGRVTVALAVVGGTMTVAAPADSAVNQFGPHTCKQGFVWREAFSGDLVCVDPRVREETRRENELGPSRRQPGGGPFGPDTCEQGFVWREARPSDRVCVPPFSRDRARSDNASAVMRLADPSAIRRGGVQIATVRHQLGGDLYASGSGLTPNGRVQFWSAAPGLPASQLSTVTANSGGGLYRKWFYGTNCRVHDPREETVIVLDAASGTVTTGGTTRVHPRC
ncbi:hypothetical protein [Streptomyces sp. DSM 40750]|uniref:hypothetical protein n=1 Tax=Streptomyces sp. DSM 40750 TaxID=2801030 RepID=UPI00214BF75D|nr:hypothetical protein [Streptomyces sp. DSM 40750]UUU26926.1 hypothetical protein JIX55_45630 [Streptomyces sp. DSM 40750]